MEEDNNQNNTSNKYNLTDWYTYLKTFLNLDILNPVVGKSILSTQNNKFIAHSLNNKITNQKLHHLTSSVGSFQLALSTF